MASVRFPNYANFPKIFQEMERMKNEMDRIFAGLMGESRFTTGAGVFPALNVIEGSDNLVVHAELPGVKPEDLEISIEGTTLNLRGERRGDDLGKVSYHRRERAAGKFQRALTLPVEINPEAVEAKCEHGVLKLTLPKAEHAKPRKITVRTDEAISNSSSIVDVSS